MYARIPLLLFLYYLFSSIAEIFWIDFSITEIHFFINLLFLLL